jgi:hypothetical protein
MNGSFYIQFKESPTVIGWPSFFLGYFDHDKYGGNMSQKLFEPGSQDRFG